jgi:hypothetical protein
MSAECPRNLFAARSGHDELLTEVRRIESGGGPPIPSGDQTSSITGVREESQAPARHSDCQDRVKRPAHPNPSNRLVAQLNATWRVLDDPLQWRLQRKKGNSRKRNSGWRDRSFCRTLEGLLRCVREYCGEVDAEAAAKLQALPDWHPDWDRKKDLQNLDVRGTDQVRGEKHTRSLNPQGFQFCEPECTECQPLPLDTYIVVPRDRGTGLGSSRSTSRSSPSTRAATRTRSSR